MTFVGEYGLRDSVFGNLINAKVSRRLRAWVSRGLRWVARLCGISLEEATPVADALDFALGGPDILSGRRSRKRRQGEFGTANR